MKIAVFGSTGKTGMEVVKQALEAGHNVIAFLRDPNKMTIKNPSLSVAPGDVMDPTSVDKAVVGVDSVIVAIGAGPETKGMVNMDGTKNIVLAMKKHGVKRIVVESSYPMSGSPESMEYLRQQMSEEEIAGMIGLIKDKSGQEKVTTESGLDWTLVRPLSLTDEPRTGNYRKGEKLDVKVGDKIARADVADFMLKCLASDEWVRKIVTVSK